MSFYLAEENAKLRKESIKGTIMYNSFFVLKKGKSYHGAVKIEFECSQKRNVFVDFAGKEIISISIYKEKINRQYVADNFKDGHIDIS